LTHTKWRRAFLIKQIDKLGIKKELPLDGVVYEFHKPILAMHLKAQITMVWEQIKERLNR
jgi:hypothetical protein